MHEPAFQNWLNHARSVGYTDAEIRTLMLKAGWSYQQVNEEMGKRGLEPGSSHPGPRGHVVKPVPINPATLIGVTLIVLVGVAAVGVLLYVLLQ